MTRQENNEFVDRIYAARKSRASHPEGTFDRHGRWYPSESEECSCCRKIRVPSRRWPYSLLHHCRTRKHVEKVVQKLGEDNCRLLAEAEKGEARMSDRRPPNRKCPDGVAYKIVALGEDGRMYSVFDGSSWILFKERRETPRRGHRGGFYVYATADQAMRAQFPSNSRLIGMPKALVKCKAGGRYCIYGSGKLSFEKVTPVNVEQIID